MLSNGILLSIFIATWLIHGSADNGVQNESIKKPQRITSPPKDQTSGVKKVKLIGSNRIVHPILNTVARFSRLQSKKFPRRDSDYKKQIIKKKNKKRRYENLWYLAKQEELRASPYANLPWYERNEIIKRKLLGLPPVSEDKKGSPQDGQKSRDLPPSA